MLGKDLLIAANGRVIAAQRTCNLNMQQDTIEVCSPVSGPWREYIPSTLGWDVSCDGLIYAPEYADELMEVLTSRKKVRLSYYDPELRIVRSGYAIPTGLQQGASISDLANYSLTFQGSGELGKVEPVAVGDYTWQIVDCVMEGYDANHRFVEAPVDGVYVWKIEVETLSRLLIEEKFRIERPFYVLFKMKIDPNGDTEFMQVRNLIYDARDTGMLRFYAQNELAHSHVNDKTGGFPIEEMEVLLKPGVYYLVATENSVPQMSLLSLPTE